MLGEFGEDNLRNAATGLYVKKLSVVLLHQVRISTA
jgi:hypothetical protein